MKEEYLQRMSIRLAFSCHIVTLTNSPVTVFPTSRTHLGTFSYSHLSIYQSVMNNKAVNNVMFD